MTQDKLVADADWELLFVEGSLQAIANLCDGRASDTTLEVGASDLGCLMETIAFRVKHARGFLDRYDSERAASERDARNEREAAVHAAIDKRVGEFVAAAVSVASPVA